MRDLISLCKQEILYLLKPIMLLFLVPVSSRSVIPCQNPPSAAIYFRSITIHTLIAADFSEKSIALRKTLPKQFHNRSISVSFTEYQS